MRSFVVILLLLACSQALAGVPAAGATPGTMMYPCDYMAISPANPGLNFDFFRIYQNTGNYGFGANEFYTNTGSLMSAQDGQTIYFLITSGFWYPNAGMLSISLNLYSDPNRASQIGTGTLTSATGFYPLRGTDPVTSANVWYLGGDVTLIYTTNVALPTGVFVNSTKTISFQQSNSMAAAWPGLETFTNRIINKTEAAPFYAPLFNTVAGTGQSAWGSVYSDYTATTYDAVAMLWGSNGYNWATNAFAGYNTGMDLALGLKCVPPPGNTGHSTPPPFSPCGLCNMAELSANCGVGTPLTAFASQGCVSLVVESNRPCTTTSVSF